MAGGITENEGLTVCALTSSGVLLVSAHLDSLEGTVLGVIRVVSALNYGAFNRVVRNLVIHFSKPSFS